MANVSDSAAMETNFDDDSSIETNSKNASDNAETNMSETRHVSQSVTRRLYLSHFLSTWNSRVFEFGAVLYLATIYPDSLLPMSVYAVFRAASAILFSPAVGRYIDRTDRLKVVRLSIVLQRVAVAMSCLGFLFPLMAQALSDYTRYAILACVSLLACIEKLGSIMNLVTVEKDWVVIVAGGNAEELATLNAQMRRIDLLCKLVGPLLIGLVDGFSTKVAIVVNLSMNVLSLPAEYHAVANVYKRAPGLQEEKNWNADGSSSSTTHAGFIAQLWGGSIVMLHQVKDYFGHRACLPSFACSILYFTVLSFAGQMVTYLIFAGYSSAYVGVARTFSVVFELAATWAAPLLMDKIGPVRAGAWFSSWQLICLAAGVAIFWEASPPLLAASGLVVGTILSRVGLRGFELATQIIVQEEVEAEQRGAFSAVEASWQNLFELCAYLTTIIFTRPSLFRWPVVMSLAATCSASILYAGFVRARRGHLVHLSDCIDTKKSKSRRGQGSEASYELLPQPVLHQEEP